MNKISRRAFLRQTGGGAATAGALAAFPGLPALRRRLRAPEVHSSGAAEPHGAAHNSPIVVHIPDPNTGTLHIMFGTREVVHHDRALVARLVHASR